MKSLCRVLSSIVIVACVTTVLAQSGIGIRGGPRIAPVDPWPMERQNRYGEAKALTGPSSYVAPWMSAFLGSGGATSHGPALGADGLGYFGNWNAHTLYKFDWRTGQILGLFNALTFVTSVPALSNGSVFFKTEGPAGNLFSLDPTIMDYNWFAPIVNYGSSPILGPNGDLVLSNTSGMCRRFTQSGSIVWSRTGLAAGTGPVVFTRDDTKVIVSTSTGVVALNYVDGSTAWSQTVGANVGGAAVSQSGVVVIGRGDGVINGLDPSTGAILWSFFALGAIQSPPAIDGDYAYLCGADARLYKINALTGHREWSFTSSNANTTPPSLGHDGRIYFFNVAGDLYCISPTGSQIWTTNLQGESRGPLTIGPDGTLYVARSDGGDNTGSGVVFIRQTPATVNGTLVFNDFVGTPPSSATFKLYLRGSSTLVATATTAIAADGSFSVQLLPSFFANGDGGTGHYDLSMKVGTWLRKRVPVNLMAGSASGVVFSLINGDINGDNAITLGDFAQLRAAYGSAPGDANWNPNADLNGNLAVTLGDFAILRKNYGIVGDN